MSLCDGVGAPRVDEQGTAALLDGLDVQHALGVGRLEGAAAGGVLGKRSVEAIALRVGLRLRLLGVRGLRHGQNRQGQGQEGARNCQRRQQAPPEHVLWRCVIHVFGSIGCEGKCIHNDSAESR